MTKKLLFLLFTVLCQLSAVHCAHAQGADLFQHVYWQAQGNRINQLWGLGGLDTIGFIDSNIQHAISISEDYEGEYNDAVGPTYSSYILNRSPVDSLHPDTARVYQFPGDQVIRAKLNADSFPDFVVYNHPARILTVLLGTSVINKFDTAVILRGDDYDFAGADVIVADLDSSGYESVLLYTDSSATSEVLTIQVFWYKGGPCDTVPRYYHVGGGYSIGGEFAIGKIKDTIHQYLCSYLALTFDSSWVFYNSIGKNFNPVIPNDSIVIYTSTMGDYTGGFLVTDADGDGIDDIMLGGTLGEVLMFKGGANISPNPSFIFHAPSSITASETYARQIIDAGDVTGHGYHSMVVTDPEESSAGLDAGAIFMYNLGKALKDSVVAYAVGPDGFNDILGTQVIGGGDIANTGRCAIIVGADEGLGGEGGVFIFLGDSSYGPTVTAVKEPVPPQSSFVLNQNYPNPFSEETEVMFTVTNPRLYGDAIKIQVYDVLGRTVETIYNGKADGESHTVHIDGSLLPVGNYFYRLSCGGEVLTKIMNVVR